MIVVNLSKLLNTHTCTRTLMGTKTLTIMDDAYELLVRQKKPNESFSEEIRRIVPKKRNLMEFAGSWSKMSDKEVKEMKKEIKNLRKMANKSFLKSIKNEIS